MRNNMYFSFNENLGKEINRDVFEIKTSPAQYKSEFRKVSEEKMDSEGFK